MNTAAQIERVLSHGQMSSTYKLAVLRAVVEFVIEHPARDAQNGFHFIPVVELARRVLTYYWGPALLDIAQGPRRNSPVIPPVVKALATSELVIPAVHARPEEGGFAMGEWFRCAERLPRRAVSAVAMVRKTLLSQPLQYIHNVGGEKEQLFSLWTSEGISPGASYEVHRKAALSGQPVLEHGAGHPKGEPRQGRQVRPPPALDPAVQRAVRRLPAGVRRFRRRPDPGRRLRDLPALPPAARPTDG